MRLLNTLLLVVLGFCCSCDAEKLSESSQISRGRDLFNSTKFDNFAGHTLSCGSCHPGGDMDGRKWLLPAVSAESLSTPTLFGVAETAPYLWFANGGSDLRAVTQTVVEDILLGTASADELDDLTAYQLSLVVPANPWRSSDGILTSSQERGKLVFENQGKCSVCHPGPLFTTRDSIQTRAGQGKVDIPSLRWVFATGPYFHDQYASSLVEVIRHYADSVSTAQMTNWGWNTLGIYDIDLTTQEKADLLEYLRTL